MQVGQTFLSVVFGRKTRWSCQMRYEKAETPRMPQNALSHHYVRDGVIDCDARNGVKGCTW
jgi:hypothetical protein